ncbi:hypothetical protein [Lonepinella sp. BR2357]|uniref:hypothetical protein n=1 Tax=Lonepinella sp. BR2357 TaxID=3434549 RepID=UPI003F6DC630
MSRFIFFYLIFMLTGCSIVWDLAYTGSRSSIWDDTWRNKDGKQMPYYINDICGRGKEYTAGVLTYEQAIEESSKCKYNKGYYFYYSFLYCRYNKVECDIQKKYEK